MCNAQRSCVERDVCSMRYVLVSTPSSSQARETEESECFHRWDLVRQEAGRQELNMTG